MWVMYRLALTAKRNPRGVSATHIKRLDDRGEVRRTLPLSVKPLAEARKLGAILWQLPPSFKRDDDRLDAA